LNYRWQIDPHRATELLASARLEIEAELARASGDISSGDADQPDASVAADDLVVEATDEALVELLTLRLEAIERAEQRLRDDTYGRSVLSGKPIPDARLEIEPWAELTVEEQAAAG
jgi:DnaK suppressor protein